MHTGKQRDRDGHMHTSRQQERNSQKQPLRDTNTYAYQRHLEVTETSLLDHKDKQTAICSRTNTTGKTQKREERDRRTEGRLNAVRPGKSTDRQTGRHARRETTKHKMLDRQIG